MRAKSLYGLSLLEEYGNGLREPYSKHVGDGLFELRVKFASDITRIFYFYVVDNKIISIWMNSWMTQNSRRNMRPCGLSTKRFGRWSLPALRAIWRRRSWRKKPASVNPISAGSRAGPAAQRLTRWPGSRRDWGKTEDWVSIKFPVSGKFTTPSFTPYRIYNALQHFTEKPENHWKYWISCTTWNSILHIRANSNPGVASIKR